MIAEYDGSNALTRRYVFGPGGQPLIWYQIGDSTPRRWLHADERGSIIVVTNDSGTMIGGGNYDEYGNPQSGAIAGRFGYTGQAWLSEIGMWYYRARIYNSALGRFMQTDPVGYGGGMNLYAYVGGDPVNLSDPLGLAGERCAQPGSNHCVPIIPPGDESEPIEVHSNCRGASCDSQPGMSNSPGPAPSSPAGPSGSGPGDDCGGSCEPILVTALPRLARPLRLLPASFQLAAGNQGDGDSDGQNRRRFCISFVAGALASFLLEVGEITIRLIRGGANPITARAIVLSLASNRFFAVLVGVGLATYATDILTGGSITEFVRRNARCE